MNKRNVAYVGLGLGMLVVVAIYFLYVNYLNELVIAGQNVRRFIFENNAVAVADQRPGDKVEVTLALFEKSGYIVIYAIGPTGEADKIIGVSTLLSNKSNALSVEVTEPIVLGHTYIVRLYEDDGDEMFDPETDLALKNSTNFPIQQAFTVVEPDTSN